MTPPGSASSCSTVARSGPYHVCGGEREQYLFAALLRPGNAVARVREQAGSRITPLVPQVAGHLGLQATLQDGLDQLRQQAARAGELYLARVDLLEQGVERAGVGEISGADERRRGRAVRG